MTSCCTQGQRAVRRDSWRSRPQAARLRSPAPPGRDDRSSLTSWTVTWAGVLSLDSFRVKLEQLPNLAEHIDIADPRGKTLLDRGALSPRSCEPSDVGRRPGGGCLLSHLCQRCLPHLSPFKSAIAATATFWIVTRRSVRWAGRRAERLGRFPRPGPCFRLSLDSGLD